MKKSKAWIKPVIFGSLFIGIIVLTQVLGLGQKLGDLKDWISSLGSLAPLVFIGTYAIATVFALPGSALTVLGGALFGSFWGVLYVLVGATIGATLAFLVSRYVMRDSIVSWLSKNKQFAKLDQMTEKHGAIMVALTRLVPLFPFNLLNFGFGVTKVPLRTYVIWTFFCMFPGTALYVVGADAVTQAIEQGQVPWVLVAILAVVVVVLTVIVRQAKQILQNKEDA